MLLSVDQNRLAFPSGVAAKANISHPAGGILRHCAVATNQLITSNVGLIDLVSGKFGVNPGATWSRSFHGIMGPTATAAINNFMRFLNKPAAIDGQFTYGGIFMITGTLSGSNVPLLVTASVPGNGGIDVRLTTGLAIQFLYNATANNALSTLAPAVGVPYFMAVSMQGTVGHFLLRNLANGALQTQTVTGLTAWTIQGGDGTYTWGASSGSTGVTLQIAAQSFSGRGLSLLQLMQWSESPWDLWYPTDGFGNYFGSTPVVVAAQNSGYTSMMMGV